MPKKAYRRLRLAALMLLMTGALIATGPEPQAARCVSLPYITYYTDATLTVECGFEDVCGAAQEGCKTPYKKSRRVLCCNPL